MTFYQSHKDLVSVAIRSLGDMQSKAFDRVMTKVKTTKLWS